jgi:hypothetical protein
MAVQLNLTTSDHKYKGSNYTGYTYWAGLHGPPAVVSFWAQTLAPQALLANCRGGGGRGDQRRAGEEQLVEAPMISLLCGEQEAETIWVCIAVWTGKRQGFLLCCLHQDLASLAVTFLGFLVQEQNLLSSPEIVLSWFGNMQIMQMHVRLLEWRFGREQGESTKVM